MTQPLISIIIPVYNARSTIERALLSAINQDYVAKEIIVIDGGSDDGTWQTIAQYNSLIQVAITEKDTGVYAAINKGIDRAKGAWMLILGADDYLYDNHVLGRCMANESKAFTLILGDVINVGAQHSLVPALHHNLLSKKLYWKNTMHQQGVFYHHSIFSDFRFDESLKVLGDYDLHLRLLQMGARALYTKTIIAKCNALGLSKQFTASLYREELSIKRNRLNFGIFVLNIPWVWLKFLIKKWS